MYHACAYYLSAVWLCRVTVRTFTSGCLSMPVCSGTVQLLTNSGCGPHQAVSIVACVSGGGADSPPRQCDCAIHWVAQLGTECYRERHRMQCNSLHTIL